MEAEAWSLEEKSGKWEPVAKTQHKKIARLVEAALRKADERALKEAADAEKRAANLAEARKIIINEDPKLPTPITAKIRDLKALVGKRVKVFGWVHRLRRQGNLLVIHVLSSIHVKI